MITADSLRYLLNDIESDRVERSVSTTNTDKFCQAITAFANDLPNHKLPGYLIVGAKDDGSFAGLDVTDDLLKNLGELRSDGHIQPLPSMSVAKFPFSEGDLAVIEVLPSDLPPVRYKGNIWIRIGPRKERASGQDERILTEKRVSHARTFDVAPCHGSTLEDLALELFRFNYLTLAVSPEVLAENNRDIQTQLASLRFWDKSTSCPTNAGMLLFGKNPLAFIEGAYIQLLRLSGTTLGSEVMMEKRLSGDLLTVLRELDSYVEMQADQRPVSASALRDESVFNYPPVALRELLMNAVLHRSYESTAPIRCYWFSDRVEIQSPGGLFGEASAGNFPNQNSYRNPVLAEAMKTLGFVNKFGRGVVRAQEALTKNGNRPAEFHFDAGFVRVEVFGRS